MCFSIAGYSTFEYCVHFSLRDSCWQRGVNYWFWRFKIVSVTLTADRGLEGWEMAVFSGRLEERQITWMGYGSISVINPDGSSPVEASNITKCVTLPDDISQTKLLWTVHQSV